MIFFSNDTRNFTHFRESNWVGHIDNLCVILCTCNREGSGYLIHKMIAESNRLSWWEFLLEGHSLLAYSFRLVVCLAQSKHQKFMNILLFI